MVSLAPTDSPRVIEASYNWADPDASARQLINALFPTWELNDGTVKIKQLTEGTTNKVFTVAQLTACRLTLFVAVQSRKTLR
jgi:hypothetical protein